MYIRIGGEKDMEEKKSTVSIKSIVHYYRLLGTIENTSGLNVYFAIHNPIYILVF